MNSFENQVSELFKDIANAPTGNVKEDFTVGTLSETFTDVFIRTIAGHLASENYVKQPRGVWIYSRNSDGFRVCKCSECKTSYGCLDTPYCPNCGALMN